MKYTPKQYASALISALEDCGKKERGVIIRRFLLILQKNRDWAKLPRIIGEAMRQYLQMSGLRKVVVESAAPVSRRTAGDINGIFGGKIFMDERVRPELLAGIRILVDDELLIDASASSGLKSLLKQ